MFMTYFTLPSPTPSLLLLPSSSPFLTCAPGNKPDVRRMSYLWCALLLVLDVPSPQIGHLPQGATHVHCVPYPQGVQVLGHLAPLGELGVHVGKVDLDDQLKVAPLVVRAHGSVGTNHQLAIDGGRHIHVVA